MQIAVSERMEEVQRNTSANTQATQSTGLSGQVPTISCRSAPEQRITDIKTRRTILGSDAKILKSQGPN